MHFSVGMLPTCMRQKMLPTCRPLIISSMRWRTVSGEPAMTWPPSIRSFQVSSAKPPRGGAYCDSAPVWMVLIVR